MNGQNIDWKTVFKYLDYKFLWNKHELEITTKIKKKPCCCADIFPGKTGDFILKKILIVFDVFSNIDSDHLVWVRSIRTNIVKTRFIMSVAL